MTGLKGLIDSAGEILLYAIGVMVAIALLVFFVGLARFIFHLGGDSEKAVEEGKNIMIWGLVSLFVMVSIWGLVAFLQSSFNVRTGILPTYDVNSLP